DLAVDLDAGFVQAADQLGIRQAVIAHGGVDADDPQAAELTLPLLAAIEHVLPRVADGFERNLPVVIAIAAEPLGVLENAVAAAPRFESTFCARHVSTSLFRPVREHGADLMFLRLVNQPRVAELALVLGRLLREDVTTIGLATLEMALGGLLEALL